MQNIEDKFFKSENFTLFRNKVWNQPIIWKKFAIFTHFSKLEFTKNNFGHFSNEITQKSKFILYTLISPFILPHFSVLLHYLTFGDSKVFFFFQFSNFCIFFCKNDNFEKLLPDQKLETTFLRNSNIIFKV